MLTQDFKDLALAKSPLKRGKRHHLSLLAAAGSIIVTLSLLSPSDRAEANRQEPLISVPIEQIQSSVLSLKLPELVQKNEVNHTTSIQNTSSWKSVTISSGDSLSQIFDNLKLSPQQLAQLVSDDKKSGQYLSSLQPKQSVKFLIEGTRLMAMRYIASKTNSTLYKYNPANNNYSVSHSAKEIEKRIVHSSGVINNSFYAAGLKAGLSDKTIMELVAVFGWDIDFALDIRSGDSFTILYEERHLEGEKLSDGEIIAAEFINQGRKVTALRHIDKHGRANYYTPKGYSLRKEFIRSPVDFRRISSKFQRSRYHPVLGKKRPHRGVDYAAST
ncbi:MAG: hypothetical protein OEL79_07505, partial [Chromatiales bacterium]|nr:hypothetical protein [Chromatiales bacterium]